MPQKKIAFIQAGAFSYTNHFVHDMLTREFPDYELQVVHVWPNLMRIRNFYSFSNLLCAVLEYKADLLVWRRIWPHLGYLFRTTYAFKQIRQRIRQHLEQDHLVFTFQTQSFFDASQPGTPHFVYTDHTVLANLSYPGYHKKDFRFPWLEYEKTVYQNARLNFTMSTNIANSIVEQYGCTPQQVACVYAGSNINGTTTPEPGNPQKYHNKHILFVGVEWERKGGPQLVAAFQQVLQQHPDARLTIVGCSPQISLPNCYVVGHAPREDVQRYYQQASIFCLPTRREPFGIVFIEAMTYKLPVVGTNIGAIPDFIVDGTNGYLVEPDDTERLSAVLRELLDQPESCAVLGENGYQMAMDRYTWEKTGKRIRQHIEMVL
jgi:glycosyltransferase involved in cell wall biosynthesis